MNKSSNRPWIDQLLCTYSWEHSKWIWMYLGDTLVQKVPGGWHISHSLGTKDYKKQNLAIPLPVVYTIKVILNCPLSKGNQAHHPKFERPNGKTQNPKFFWNRSRIGAASSLESSMKRILWIFESNQNKWKSMTFLIVLHLKPKTLLN